LIEKRKTKNKNKDKNDIAHLKARAVLYAEQIYIVLTQFKQRITGTFSTDMFYDKGSLQRVCALLRLDN